MRYGMKSVIASCLAVTVAAVAFRSSELRDETLYTWDREAYLRAIATEPRWMEVLDRLCADQI